MSEPIPISPDWLRQEFIEEIPCGECVTTRYTDKSGIVMRQDIEIRITKGTLLGADQGRIG